jgi:PKD repeat protein
MTPSTFSSLQSEPLPLSKESILKTLVRSSLISLLIGFIASLGSFGCAEDSEGLSTFDVLITATPERLNALSMIQFESKGNGPIDGVYEYSWDFGDGATSEEVTPEHVYESAGLFTVTLQVSETQSSASGSATLEVEVLGGISLGVDAVNFSPSTPVSSGQDVTVSWSISQTGAENTTPWDLQIFAFRAPEDGDRPALSEEELISAPGYTPLQRQPQMANQPPGERSFELGVTLPEGLETGDYFIGVYADPDQAISEVSRVDNIALSAIPLRVRNALDTGPDFSVCGIDVPAFAQLEVGQRPIIPQGDQIALTLCLSNVGDRPAVETPFALYLSADATLDDDDLLIEIGAEQALGASDQLQREILVDLPIDLEAGTYRFIGVADPEDRVIERREDNNSRISGVPFDIVEPGEVEGVDLVVGGFSVNEPQVYWGQLLTGTLTLQNRGDQPVSRLFVVRFNAVPVEGGNTVQLPSLNIDGIEALETKEVPFELTISQRVTPGRYRLQVEVDPTNSSQDVNPGNNRRNLAEIIDLGGEPRFDPVARTLTLGTEEIDAGTSLSVTLTVENIGEDPTGSFSVELSLSQDERLAQGDISLGTEQIDSLAGGERREIPLTFEVPLSLDQQILEWRVVAVIDPNNQLTGELSEENNIVFAEASLTVNGAMGGCGEDEYEDNDTAGQAVPLTEGIYENLGACDSEDWFSTQIEADELFSVTLSWPSTGGGAVTPTLSFADEGGQIILEGERRGEALTFTRPAQTQNYRALYRVTGGGAPISYTLTVEKRPPEEEVDLHLSQLTLRPAVAESEAPVEARMLLSNLGGADAPSSEVQFRLMSGPSPDSAEVATLDTVDTPALSAGASIELSITMTLPADLNDGLYYLLAEVVEGEGWAIAPLRIDEAQACTSDDFEPNGSPLEPNGLNQRAAELSSGTYSDLYTCDGDDDWYRVRLEADDALSALIEFNTQEGDLDLALYDADGETLIAESTSLQGREQVEIFRSAQAQDYLLRVYLNPSDEVNVTTRYTLTLDVGASQTCGNDGYEPNGSAEEATPLSDGIHDLIVCPGGEDWFRFNIPAGNTVSFQVATGIGAVELALFGPDDGLIDSSGRRIAHEAVLTGAYRLRVRPTMQDAPASYSLSISGVSGVDLALDALTLTSEVAAPGDELLARTTLTNLRGDTAEAVRVRFTLSQDERATDDDTLLGEQVIPLIEGASSQTINQRLRVPRSALVGAQFLIAEIDPDRLLPDIRPGNNVFTLPFLVIGECIDDDQRENEGPLTATALEWTDSQYSATLCSYTEDWYALTVPSGDATLTLEADAGGDLDLRLYRADDLTLLGESVQDGDFIEEVSVNFDQSTQVLVQVDGFLDARAEYTLDWRSE